MTDSPRSAGAGRLRRVLYAIALDPSRKFGSLEEQILTLALAFRQRGGLLLPLFVTSSAPEQALGFAEAGVEVACLDLTRFRPGAVWRLRGLVARHGIEVAHWGMMSPLSPYIAALSVLAPRVRHYFTDHSSRPVPGPGRTRQPVRALKRLLLRRFARVVCVSEFVRRCQEEQGVWSNHLTCLHFINTDRFRPDDAARREGRARLLGPDQAGAFVALAVGQLIPEKGIDVLIRALPLLPPRVIAWVAGEGPARAALEALARELGVAERVRFFGSQAHVQLCMQAADCAVCPSLWAEAAGLVNIEAQACGLPVVASHIGGIPEYVADGRTGLLFAPGDHAALAGHLRRLADDSDLRDALGAAARVHAVDHFSPAALLEEYLDLYRDGPAGAAVAAAERSRPVRALTSC